MALLSEGTPLLVWTDRRRAEAAGRSLAEAVRAAVEAGARAVVLREKDLPREARRALALGSKQALDRVGGALIVASDPWLAREVGARGVHLAAADPWPEAADGLWVGVSCHSAAEVAAAHARGADYATLSPIFETRSKPGYGPALGLEVLAGHPLPVYALGGVVPGRARACVEAGAAGVAVMGAAMDDPRVVGELLAELGG